MKPITIIGAGISGLSLGLALRQSRAPVTIIEAGKLPRHRVCGEFVSGRGQRILAELGLVEMLRARGARPAATVQFFSEGLSRTIHLAEPGLCCSRFTFDQLLASEFQRAGGELKQQERWQGDEPTPGLVLANGRKLHPHHNGWRWLGLKAHAREITRVADLEIHLTKNGYVGLCDIESGSTNVCGLFRSRTPWAHLGERWIDQLRGPAGSDLHGRTAKAHFDADSFCSVTGFGFAPRLIGHEPGCRLGDAYSMIAPIAGNGMSIALESAALATDPLLDYSRGRIHWPECTQEIHQRFRHAFKKRLWLAWLIQETLFHPILRQSVIRLFWHWPNAIQLLFQHTR